MSTMDDQLVRRHVTLPDLVDTLRQQQDAKLDVVIPAASTSGQIGEPLRRRMQRRPDLAEAGLLGWRRAAVVVVTSHVRSLRAWR